MLLASLACGPLFGPAPTPEPTLPAPLRWRHLAGSSVISPPAVADGLLVFTNEFHAVVAFDAATGSPKWQHAFDSIDRLERPLAVDAGAVLVEEAVYSDAAHSLTYVVGLDLHTGQVKWQTAMAPYETPYLFYHPQAAGGTVYFEVETAPNHRLLNAADSATGALRWQAPLTDTALAGDPAIDGGLVFLSIDHPMALGASTFTIDLLALDAATGARRWTVETGTQSNPILAAGSGRLYVTRNNGLCVALDEATGKVDWQFKFANDQPAPPLLTGDTLYFGDGQGKLYSLDASSGALRWTAKLGAALRRRPAVSGGRVYVGSDDGYLNALDAATGALIWTTRNPLREAFATTPYIPAMDTEPVLAGGTLYYFNVEELIALQVP